MNNPQNLPIDIEEQRDWLNAHKAELALSWSELARQIGIAQGSLSPFGGGTYAGDCRKIAEAVYRYRQVLHERARIEIEAPEVPRYFETPTSRRMNAILSYAQARGRMVVIATAPGLGKTESLRNYEEAAPNVWSSTMAPSTAGVNNMQIEVLESFGESNAKGTPQALSRRIKARVRGSNGLIAIDEAQNLSEKALEEIRAWHDATGVGIALIGNEDVLKRLELGSRKDAFARLASRVSQRLIAYQPMEGDILALADAWGVADPEMRQFLVRLQQQPGALRTLTMLMETATMLAASDRQPLSLAYLKEGWALQSQRQLAA